MDILHKGSLLVEFGFKTLLQPKGFFFYFFYEKSKVEAYSASSGILQVVIGRRLPIASLRYDITLVYRFAKFGPGLAF
jgi:hypothetical protein